MVTCDCILFYTFYNINEIGTDILLMSHFDIILTQLPLAHFFQRILDVNLSLRNL